MANPPTIRQPTLCETWFRHFLKVNVCIAQLAHQVLWTFAGSVVVLSQRLVVSVGRLVQARVASAMPPMLARIPVWRPVLFLVCPPLPQASWVHGNHGALVRFLDRHPPALICSRRPFFPQGRRHAPESIRSAWLLVRRRCLPLRRGIGTTACAHLMPALSAATSVRALTTLIDLLCELVCGSKLVLSYRHEPCCEPAAEAFFKKADQL